MRVGIIGAGITGLYLAWKLSEKGHKTTIFEKRDKIGKEACSGLFSERILSFIPQSEKLTQNQINFASIHFPKKTVRVNFAKKFFVMSHEKLDVLTADLARKSGAEIRFSQNIQNNSPVLLKKEFDIIIGCDGANSEVRKFLKMREPAYRLGILGFIRQKDTSDFVETWPVKKGFIWRIPRGEEVEYGIIAGPEKAKNLLDDFCQKNNLQLGNIKSALIPQGFLIPGNAAITLCGDASGFTKPWSGGGVIWGLQAAELLLKNFPDLLKYRQDAKRSFYLKMIFSRYFTRAVYLLGNKFPWLLPNKIRIEGDKLL